MNVFLVTYDLLKQGQDYTTLIARLQQYKSLRILLSTWLVRSNADAAAVRDDLGRYIDSNDRLMVVALTGEAAWRNAWPSHQAIMDFLNGK